MNSILEIVNRVAENTLIPNAADVDTRQELPAEHLDTLRTSGLLGALTAGTDALAAGEILTASCMATGFVWAQHIGATARALAVGQHQLAARLSSGELLGGVSYAGLPSHGAHMHMTSTDDGTVILNGRAPFVTSWPWIDVLTLWAIDEHTDQVHCLLIDDPQTAGFEAQRLDLIAANASATHQLRATDLELHATIISSKAAASARTLAPYTARLNSVLPLGLLRGISTDLTNAGETDTATAIDDRTTAIRRRLDVATATTDQPAMLAARADLLALTQTAAGALARTEGSRVALRSSLGERRQREATFVQAAATTTAERHAATAATFAQENTTQK